MATFLYRSGKVFIVIFLVLIIPLSGSVKFQLSRFSPDENTIVLEGDAVYYVGQIEFNKANWFCRVGRVLYNGKVPLWDTHSGKLADFSTHFTFTVDTQGRSQYGNGLAFFLAPVGFQIPPNSIGGFLGLFNTSNTDTSQIQIVTVEFDTHANPEWDPSYEHVGINNNSIASAVTAPWNVTLHSGDNGDAWITYNATTTNLSVFWGYGGGPNSSLSYQIDLKKALPQWVTIGISAATGCYLERHILKSWEFSSSLDIKDSNGNHGKNIHKILGFAPSAGLVVAGVVVLYVVWKRNRRDGVRVEEKDNPEQPKSTSINEHLEKRAGPRRFSYEVLAKATDNFSNDRKLGEGGFGEVYEGKLVDPNKTIAVKKLSRTSKQGKREYITEVKVIGMLRHRNLVELIGWCHDQKGELLLVYEFMPNGSLNNHLFGSKNRVLDWAVRYQIALDLASGLLYLHEDSGQHVLHRDIKSSNVMLDEKFVAKIGDFGLARLMDNINDITVAGTPAYIAPEYAREGWPSKETDVYSFGVVALEIATGINPNSRFDDEPHTGLVGWVWNHYGSGQLLSAVDKRLEMRFEPRQMECLIIVGLWCAHPDCRQRPSIREASRVLNFEAELPQLPTRMPVSMYHPPPRSPSISSVKPSITSSIINMGR